jgi:mRNA interferase MazF
MEIKRGDVVICAAPGDYGKPRPAVVVQSDLFNATHSSVVVCLITSHLEDAPLFRIPVPAGRTTGLKLESQVMVDKVIAIPRNKITGRAGAIPAGALKEVDHALRLWLELVSGM